MRLYFSIYLYLKVDVNQRCCIPNFMETAPHLFSSQTAKRLVDNCYPEDTREHENGYSLVPKLLVEGRPYIYNIYFLKSEFGTFTLSS